MWAASVRAELRTSTVLTYMDTLKPLRWRCEEQQGTFKKPATKQPN